MKALSIRQPWAWLIIRPDITDLAERAIALANSLFKDIENRSWKTHFRGTIAVHASAGMTRSEYAVAEETVELACAFNSNQIALPPFKALQRGGIIGTVDIVGCVDKSPSPWFLGDFGFLLENPQIVKFKPFKGALGFFEVGEVVTK